MRDTTDLPHYVRCWAGEGEVVDSETVGLEFGGQADDLLHVLTDRGVYPVLKSDVTPV